MYLYLPMYLVSCSLNNEVLFVMGKFSLGINYIGTGPLDLTMIEMG